MTLIILSIIYALIVAGDVWITLWAVRHGKGEEANVLLRPFLHYPISLIMIEVVLYVLVVVSASFVWPIFIFAILWRGLILAHNIIIIRSK